MIKEQRAKFSELFKRIITEMPKAKRLKVKDEITTLCTFLCIDEDLIDVDRRGKHWTERSEEEKLDVKRKQLEKQREYAAELRARVRAERDKLKEYRLNCRGKYTMDVDIKRAGEILGVSPQSIHNKMAKSINKMAHYNVNDEVYTIYRKDRIK
jgi:hypothetical protein